MGRVPRTSSVAPWLAIAAFVAVVAMVQAWNIATYRECRRDGHTANFCIRLVMR